MKISLEEARRIILHAQGLANHDPFGTGIEGTQKAIDHLSYVQIDTISVVERAHHHVLWARVPDYQPSFLLDLVKNRKVFEYWSHAAAYLPMKDFRFAMPRMNAIANGERHWFPRTKENERWMVKVLDRIRAEGALMARDFEHSQTKKSGPWFEWKPAKKALEQLYMEGKLLISERRGFQKVYDLPERVLPKNINYTLPSKLEFARYLMLSSLRSHGLVAEEEIRYLRKNIKIEINKCLKEMLDANEIQEITVDSLETKCFALPSAGKIQTGTQNDRVSILSPFDNCVIQRKRLKAIFDFDYQIECYLPEAKRMFGYFCLPILKNEQFIGRMDAKADRKEKCLVVKSLYLEKKKSEDSDSLREAITRFAQFNGCTTIRVEKTNPPKLRSRLKFT